MSEIQIQVDPRAYLGGSPLTGQVVLIASKELKCRAVHITFDANEHTRVTRSSGKHSYTYTETNTMVHDERILHDAGELPPGTYTFPFAFVVPPGPPSFHLGGLDIGYVLKTWVDVPFGFDVEQAVEILVVNPQPPPRELIAPRVFQSEQVEGKPSLELRLDRTAFGPGDTVTGHVVVHHLAGKHVRKVDLALAHVVEIRAQGHTDRPESTAASLGIPFNGEEGQPFGFRMPFALAASQCPTYVGMYSNARWILTANLDIAWAFDIKTSVELVVAGAPPA